MKNILLSLFLMQVFLLSPVYADYKGMKQAFDRYSPPGHFTTALDPFPKENEPVHGAVEALAPVIYQIKTLKEHYEKKIPALNTLFLTASMDPKRFEEISTLARDQDALIIRMGQNVRLEEIKIIGALRNPAIFSAQEKVRAEINSFSQVMDLDENLGQYSAFTPGISHKVGPLKPKASINMTYPFPGLTALKGRIIQAQVDLLNEKMKIVKKNVITDIETAYWDLVFIERSTGITVDTIAAFNRLRDVATILYKSGKTSFQDVIKININIEILKEELVTFKSQKKNIEVKILELLSLPVEIPVGKAIAHPLPGNTATPEALYPVARKYRQELNMIRYQILKLENMIEMSESMIHPPFSPGLSTFGNETINMVGSDAPKKSFAEKTMAAMENNTPIKPWYGLDEPWLNQTKQNLLSLKHTLVKEENATDRMVRNAWFKVDKTRRELDLYQERILSLSRSALDVSTREYESGTIPFSQAIDSYTYWLKVKLGIAKRQTDLGASTAALEKLLGRIF